MRAGGLALFIVGLLATIICSMTGCNTFFSWNGRHAVEARPLTEEQTHTSFTTTPGYRYTLAVQAVFDPHSVDDKDGMADVDLKMPLTVKAKDTHGTSLAEASGWLEQGKPNIFYSRPIHEANREIMVERLVGPFYAANPSEVSVDIQLGADRVGRNVVSERRFVVYDDALPPSIRNALVGAISGLIALVTGFVLLFLSWWRSRGRRRKRSGIPL